MSALTESPAWQALAAHHKTMRDVHMRSLFAEDPKRAATFTLTLDTAVLPAAS